MDIVWTGRGCGSVKTNWNETIFGSAILFLPAQPQRLRLRRSLRYSSTTTTQCPSYRTRWRSDLFLSLLTAVHNKNQNAEKDLIGEAALAEPTPHARALFPSLYPPLYALLHSVKLFQWRIMTSANWSPFLLRFHVPHVAILRGFPLTNLALPSPRESLLSSSIMWFRFLSKNEGRRFKKLWGRRGVPGKKKPKSGDSPFLPVSPAELKNPLWT